MTIFKFWQDESAVYTFSFFTIKYTHKSVHFSINCFTAVIHTRLTGLSNVKVHLVILTMIILTNLSAATIGIVRKYSDCGDQEPIFQQSWAGVE